MSRKLTYILLTIIVFIAIVLRFYQLGNVPISPDWDEAALGYSAYSIIETGRDEYGKFLPVVLRSFDDYKPALYVYFTIPSVLLFDVTTYAVRFPSAFIAIFVVLAVFFLMQELFRDNKYKDHLSLIATFFMAVSPWHIQFSRIAFESNSGMAFNLFTVMFFVKGLRSPKFLILSSIFAGLSVYIYQSEKVFTPLLILLLLLVYFKNFIKLPKKYIVGFFVLTFIIVLPMLMYLLTDKNSLMRVRGTSIFSEQTVVLQDSIKKLELEKNKNNFIGEVFYNRRVIYFKEIVDNYLSHYYLNWLFITGDLIRHHAPNMGLLYIFELPFLFLGLYSLAFDKFSKQTKLLIFGWFLITPIPASITTGVPHAVRTLNFLPTFQIFTALGLVSFFSLNLVRKFKNVFYMLLPLLFLFNFLYYLNQYFVQQNYFTATEWQYGWKEATDFVKVNGSKYQKIIVSDKAPLDRSYMFFAFYLKYSPTDYQKEEANKSGGFAEHHAYGKYEFRPIDWSKDSKEKGVLIIGNPDEIPIAPIVTISTPNGKPIIEIVDR